MARRTITFGILTCLLIAASPAQANRGKALQALVKILTGAGAAESLRRSAHSFDQYQTERTVLQRLQEQGLDCNKDAIYSVYFQTNGGYWADFWTKPDLFFYVDIEGKGSFLVPQIHNNYRGGPILDRILAEEAPPGSRIVIRVMDDDTTSDHIWNNILRTRIGIQATAEVRVTRFVPVRANASGQLQLLDRELTIDASDYIASAVFEVPKTKDGVWIADGQLLDASGKAVGAIQMASVWSARKDFAAQSSWVSSLFSSAVFWLVIGGCLLFWFVATVLQGNRTRPATPTTDARA
jgi:hypothetical protein